MTFLRILSSCKIDRFLLASVPLLKYAPIFRRTYAKNVSAGRGKKKKCSFYRSAEARISEFWWFAEVRSCCARNKRHCKAPRRRKQNTAAGYNRARRNGLFARELSLPPCPLDGLETRRFELRNSTPRRVIVTRFHRQRDIRDTSSRATLSLGKSLPDNAHVCQTFGEFPAPRASRIYATDFAALSRANTIYTYTYIYKYIYRHVDVYYFVRVYIYIWHFYQLCQSLANLDACVTILLSVEQNFVTFAQQKTS